jgi:hypothetical protein
VPKAPRGRLSGHHGMEAHSARALEARAGQLEVQAKDPASGDDPRWLLRQATKLRKVADGKEKALDHKRGRAKRGGSGV